jgi:hypothetical protein
MTNFNIGAGQSRLIDANPLDSSLNPQAATDPATPYVWTSSLDLVTVTPSASGTSATVSIRPGIFGQVAKITVQFLPLGGTLQTAEFTVTCIPQTSNPAAALSFAQDPNQP